MNETIDSISALSYFAAVAETLSFRAAAERMNTSPATISRRISELEKTLDVQLLVRTTRNVYLTEVGSKLLANVAPALGTLRDATEQASHDRDRIEGVVRIATTHTLAQTNILPVIPRLRAEYPDLRLEILLDERVVDIRAQGIDIALRAGTLKDPTLMARKICTHTIYSYVTPELLLNSNRPILSYGGMGEEVPPCVDVKDMRLLHMLVMAGQGEAQLPDALVRDDLRAGRLVPVPNGKAFAFDIYLVFHPNRFIPRRMRHVLDVLVTYAATTDSSNLAGVTDGFNI